MVDFTNLSKAAVFDIMAAVAHLGKGVDMLMTNDDPTAKALGQELKEVLVPALAAYDVKAANILETLNAAEIRDLVVVLQKKGLRS